MLRWGKPSSGFAVCAEDYWSDSDASGGIRGYENRFVERSKEEAPPIFFYVGNLVHQLTKLSGQLARSLLDLSWERVCQACEEIAACTFGGGQFFGGPLSKEEVLTELARARKLFPSSPGLFAALIEEIGELSEELLHPESLRGASRNSRTEAVQVIAMCVRLAFEGDPTLTEVRRSRRAVSTKGTK